MTPAGHKLYVFTLVIIVVTVTLFLSVNGATYYITDLEERFYHENHLLLKPNGLVGHGLGIAGTLLILFGVFGYMARKRFRSLSRLGALKYWLEFHIFLCTLGPIMILFHTAFKFGGIVSISFWSMVAVVASGVIGRFIYLQIPRTIQGRELSLQEIHDLRSTRLLTLPSGGGLIDLNVLLSEAVSGQKEYVGLKGMLNQYFDEYTKKKDIQSKLKSQGLSSHDIKEIVKTVSHEIVLNRKIKRLVTMQRYFRYWHIAHLPFAIIMLIIMVIHVAVTVAFGYTWIF